MTLVAADVLVGRGLQIDAVQGEAVQGTEQLVLVVGVDSLDHVKVGLHGLAPGTRCSLAVTCLEAERARGGAEVAQLALVLDRLRRAAVQVANLITVLALADGQLVGVAERHEARLAAQLVHLAFERYLVHRRRHLVADGALDLARLGARVHALDATRPRDLDVLVLRRFRRLRVLLELPETRLRAEVAERRALADRGHERVRVRAHILAALRTQLLSLLEVVATARVAESHQVLADFQRKRILRRDVCATERTRHRRLLGRCCYSRSSLCRNLHLEVSRRVRAKHFEAVVVAQMFDVTITHYVILALSDLRTEKKRSISGALSHFKRFLNVFFYKKAKLAQELFREKIGSRLKIATTNGTKLAVK